MAEKKDNDADELRTLNELAAKDVNWTMDDMTEAVTADCEALDDLPELPQKSTRALRCDDLGRDNGTTCATEEASKWDSTPNSAVHTRQAYAQITPPYESASLLCVLKG